MDAKRLSRATGPASSRRSSFTLDEATQRPGASVRNHGETNSPGIPTGLPFAAAAGRLTLTDFDGVGQQNHVMNAAPFAVGTPTKVGFISLEALIGLATNPLLVGVHHASVQYVQNLKGSLVARQTESGVCVRSMTVPTVRIVSRLQWRHRNTQGRLAKWYGSPDAPQSSQMNQPPHRARSR